MRHKVMKPIVRWLLFRVFRIEVVGIENIPATGPCIVVANHSAVVDSVILSAVIRRPIVFIAKNSYFKWYHPMRILVGGGNGISVDRNSVVSGGRAVIESIKRLRHGDLIGIHPEGTRTPSGQVFIGDPSFITMARRSGAEIVPVALVGTEFANPPGSRKVKFRAKIQVVVGKPYDLPDDVDVALRKRLTSMKLPDKLISSVISQTKKLRRELGAEKDSSRHARHVMRAIAELGGFKYIDSHPVRVIDQTRDEE